MFGMSGDEILKGTPPTYENKNFKDWLKYYCSRNHWDRTKYVENALDEEGDGYFKPTLKLFLYNVYCDIRNWNICCFVRYWWKKIFSKDHLAGREIWDAKSNLAAYNLKVIRAFRNSERMGYPSYFSEYDENAWKSKEEYEQAIEDGRMGGGGEKAWEEVLDRIIMAFEYITIEGSFEKQSEWFIKYFGMDPYDKTNKCNEDISYTYRNIDEKKNIGCTSSSKMPDLDKVEWCTKSVSYMNMPLIFYAEEVVQNNLELFGKFFQNLWD